MLKLPNQHRGLASENIFDFMNQFPVLCAESACQQVSLEVFTSQLLLETSVMPNDDREVIMQALQEGAVASIIETAQNFIKSVIEFFKKLIDRLRVSFSANSEAIDKWLEKVKTRLDANKKNGPKYSYEGYKWSPTQLDKFSNDVLTVLPDPVHIFAEDMKKESKEFESALDTKHKQEKGKLLDDDKARKIKQDAKDSDKPKKEVNSIKSNTNDKLANDQTALKDADKLINDLDKEGQDITDAVDGEDPKKVAEDGATKYYESMKKDMLDDLFNNDDETKGMEQVRLAIHGGADKTTIKGFAHISIDNMLAAIKDYKKISDQYTTEYTKLLEGYNASETVLSSSAFDTSRASDDTKNKTKNSVDYKKAKMAAALNHLRWSQNILNTSTKNCMSWHKEMVNDFMKTITAFAMTNF